MVELQISAPKQIPFIEVIFFKFGSTQPTPLVFAFRAGHMITTFIWNFSYPSFTFLTIHYISLLFCPQFVVLVLNLFASLSFVIWSATSKTNLLLAFLTNSCLFTYCWSAVRCWTPLKRRIQIDLNVLLKQVKLCLIFVCSKFLNVLIGNKISATNCNTWYSDNLSISNVYG